MKSSLLIIVIVSQVALSYLVGCDFTGAMCVDHKGERVHGTCTKYYALCTENHVQTKPIEVNNPLTTSCRDGIIVAASSCNLPHTCTDLGIHCTDTQGTEVRGSCSSFYRECDDGVLTDVMPVAYGTKCLNKAIVLNSVCSSAECSFEGIQCTNGAGEFVNTYCTGYFVECVDGNISSPMDVPPGTQCYMDNFVISGTCPNPGCSFNGIRCSDTTGNVVTNSCTDHFVECSNGTYSGPMPVAKGTQCYNDQIVLFESCSAAECTGSGIVCTDIQGIIEYDTCSGYFRQCVDGIYGIIEDVPIGTRCKNSEILLTNSCSSPCVDFTDGERTKRCTDSNGVPITGTCTKYFQRCVNSSFYDVIENTEPGMNCYNGQIITDGQCTSANYECDFVGIRCSTEDGTLTTKTCSGYYVMCQFGFYTVPAQTTPGTRCFNNELVLEASCSQTCSYDGIKCSDYNGDVMMNTCTSYYVECDNGLTTNPRPVAAGTRCKNSDIIAISECREPLCTDGDIICSTEDGSIGSIGCTDYYMECFNGLFIDPRPVAYGTKCLKNQIVLVSACTGATCQFEGVKCSDANGVIYENMCENYFIQCNNGILTAPMPVANGTRCYNGILVNTNECIYQKCDFDGIKCSDSNGVIYSNTCTSYFLQCGEDSLSQPMPVADGTRCYGNKIVNAVECNESDCSYDGIKCTDADGDIFINTCTSHYTECDNGSQTAPRPVADGTRCYNGEQVLPSACLAIECDYEGIHCTDANGIYYPDTCTSYFTQCDNGMFTPAREVPIGTRCLKNELVLSSLCSGVQCDYNGIKCTDAYGDVMINTCTSHYVECDNGSQTAPRPVAAGTRCYNNDIILSANCTSIDCTFTGIKCSNAEGIVNISTCTSYFIECDNGYNTPPMPVADGTRCLKGVLVNADKCQGTQCMKDKIVCVNAEGIQFIDTCTNYFAECVNGMYSAPRPVASGTRCLNGEQVLASICPGVECSTPNIRCSDQHGVVFDDVCTSFFLECDDGSYTVPMPVAPGTFCLDGQLVLPFNCTGTDCDFEGLQCTDASGVVYDRTCTDYFIECANGFVTIPMLVPNGAKCLGGKIVLNSVCPGAECTYTGFKCAKADGTVVRDACTSFYIECVNGMKSKSFPVAPGTRCYNEEFVPIGYCSAPQCSFTGVRCTDEKGSHIIGQCSNYFTKCIKGVLVGPTQVPVNEQCLNDKIVSSTLCIPKECDFNGFICSNAKGELMIDTCTGFFVECIDNKYSKPIVVAPNSRCYNQQIVSSTSSQCCSTTGCEFEGIRCSDNSGKIIANRCTNYYVMCDNGVQTKPRVTAEGTRCYNNEQVLTSACEDIGCSFSGKMCVDNAGGFVMNTCTTKYAQCIDNTQVINDVPTGKACFNSQIIAEKDSSCKITVEVQENKAKGIRGRH